MITIENKTFGEERALYGSNEITLINCRFDGDEDGESALKESRHINIKDCVCNLRYPFWHDNFVDIRNTLFTENCRAALWYSNHVDIHGSKLFGTKALRESSDVIIKNCDIVSSEFGWRLDDVRIESCQAQGEYLLLGSQKICMYDTEFSGKYSLQYVTDAIIENCVLNTKDALWHAKNVTIKNSVINGEYLGWYSENLTFINCKISGTQPLCYCKNLEFFHCELNRADLAFERSDVKATLTAPIISIKNAYSGYIECPAVDEIICDDPNAKCDIRITK